MNRPPKIVLIDDHPLYRSGVRSHLEQAGYTQVYEFASVIQSRQFMLDNQPEILFLDIGLGEENGLKLLPEILQNSRSTKVYLLTTYNDKSYIDLAQSIGAAGFVLKDEDPDQILSCIKHKSNNFLLSNELRKALRSSQQTELWKDVSRFELLSKREKEILLLVGGDLTSKEVGAQLDISFRTVQNHRASIKEKLMIKKNSELIKAAIFYGKVSPKG